MKRVVTLSLVLFSVLIFGLATLTKEIIILSIPLLCYLAVGLFLKPGEIQLNVLREIKPDRAMPGQPITNHLAITTKGLGVGYLYLGDHLPDHIHLAKGNTKFLTSLKNLPAKEYSYKVKGKRGRHVYQKLSVQVMDPLWLTTHSYEIQAPGRILINPAVTDLEPLDIRPRNTRVYAGTIPARQGGPGLDFFDVRQYQPGDPLRWINWRASARYQHSLFINQFEQYRVTDVGVILDTRRSSEIILESGKSLFEYSVDAAAALAIRFLKDGNRVSLLMYGTQLDWTLPGYSKLQQERIKNSLARAELGDSLVFDTLEKIPTQLLPSKSQLVLISPLQAEDYPALINLRSRGYSLLVVSPEPILFELRDLEEADENVDLAMKFASIERKLLVQRLRQAGIQVVNWDVSVPLNAALQQFYARPLPAIVSWRF
jgi:uncharacterized protein (DUF58 family)